MPEGVTRWRVALSSVTLVAGLVAAGTLGCVGALEVPPDRSSRDFEDTEQGDQDLQHLREVADAAPADLAGQWRAGMAHARATLRGDVDLRDHAEAYLERAWRLDPRGEVVPAAKVLARFLNMRNVVLDYAKLDLQIELYRSLLGEDAPRDEDPLEMSAPRFHVTVFAEAGEALRAYADGHTLTALRKLRALERQMEARTQRHPDEIDTCAMAGNFELTFAGVVPVGVKRRLARGVGYLETQQDHWDELSPAARSVGVAPNVRSVFALFLAEGLLAAGEQGRAAERYRQIQTLEAQPDTAVRRQVLAVVEHRLAHLEVYAGDRSLLPPWPTGVTGCVACHASEASVPTDDLYLAPDLARPEGL